MKDTKPSGNARYEWGETNNSGSVSLLGDQMPNPLTKNEAENSLSSESFHPNSDAPEEDVWDPALLVQARRYGESMAIGLMGSNPGGNFKYTRWLVLQNLAKYGWTISQNVTETDCYQTDPIVQARQTTRQFLGLQADGIQLIDFFQLYDSTASCSYVNYNAATKTMSPLPAYTTIQKMMQDAAKIGVAPKSYTQTSLPSVPSYNSPYPLLIAPIVGRRCKNVKRNSILFAAWQSSYLLHLATDLVARPSDGAVTLIRSTTYGTLKYNIERAKMSGGPYTHVTTVDAALDTHYINGPHQVNTYADTGLTRRATYYYVVMAQVDACTSGKSNEVNVVAALSGAVNKTSLPAAAPLTFTTLPRATVTVLLPADSRRPRRGT